jgi:hypothetical protein
MTFPVFTAGEVLRAQDMNAVGMWKVASATFSGITTGAPLDVNSVFSSNYTNYLLTFNVSATVANAIVQLRMRTVAAQEAGAVYNFGWNGQWVSAGPVYNEGAFSTANPFAPETAFFSGVSAGTGYSGTSRVEIYSPNATRQTRITGQSYTDYTGTFYNVVLAGSGEVSTSTAYTGFRIYPAAGTISGEYTLYGYNK